LKLLITGAGTLLGNNLAKKAKLKEFDVIATYRNSYPKNLKREKIRILKLDLEKEFNINFNVDCLVHCASAIPSDNLDHNTTMKVNFIGFKRLVKQSLKNGCKKIILISTMSVYGDIKKGKVTEKTKLHPINSYGKSKLKMEKFLQDISKKNKISFYILRLPGLIGFKSDFNYISKTLKNIKNKKLVEFSNPNLKFNNMVHVENLTDIIIKICRLKGSKILNIASKNPIMLKNIIALMFKFEKKEKNINILQSKKKGFSIEISNYLRKNFKLFSVKNSLSLFLKENQNK
tara:strand:+ start:787 stop:1653 length:867 start_codon:yes stop_codon:yes gene_type:complete